jgi:signal transduction histidine kinase
MPDGSIDPRWPKLMSLSVHEFRTPLTVIAGYVRMLLKDRAGPMNDQQRKLLEETEKSCARLSALLTEVSDLANLEAGNISVNRQNADLRAILTRAIDQLPAMADRDVPIALEMGQGPAAIHADTARLTTALTSIIGALRRELVASDKLIVREEPTKGSEPGHRILIGDADTIAMLAAAAGDLPTFDEWRGGCGLRLPVARRILNAHGGQISSPPDGRRAGALIVLPATG